MKRIVFFFVLFAIAAGSAHAQNANVTATIVDPNGLPYSFAQVSVRLQPPGVSSPVCGGPGGGGVSDQQVTTNAAGTFTVSLCPNASIIPSSPATTWSFTVSEAGVPPPLGTGPQSFSVTATISSGNQDISSQLNPAAPALSNFGNGGLVGPGTPNSVSCFKTTTNVGNCPGGATDIGGVFTIPEEVVVGGGTGPASFGLPLGNPSLCLAPTAGFTNFCSDGTNNAGDISVNGSPYIPIGSLAGGSPGLPAAYTGPNAAVSVPIAIDADAITGAGVGATPVAWVSNTTYGLGQSVSFSGGNYVAVSANNGTTTPGTNRGVWYPVPNGSRSTQYDTAFYVAQSIVNTTTGSALQIGKGVYNSCIGMTYPTVTSAGLPGVNIHGAGKKVSIISQTCTLLSGSGGDGLAMLNVPPATSASLLPTLEFTDFTLEANAMAPAIFDLHACQHCDVERLYLNDPAPGTDHAFEFGGPSADSSHWVFELTMHDVVISYNPNVTGFGHGNSAFASTVSVTGGIPTITVTNGGANYDAGQLTGQLVLIGALPACSVPGTLTFTVASGVITGVTSTATGCDNSHTVSLQIYPQIAVNYGFKFTNMTDSRFVGDLNCSGVGAIACVYLSNVSSANAFYKIHPIHTFNGIQVSQNNNFFTTQIDSVYNWGFDFEGLGYMTNVIGTEVEWDQTTYTASSDYHFGTVANTPSNSPAEITIWGDICLNTPQQVGYGHFVTPSGVVDTGATMPTFVSALFPQYCNQRTTNAIQVANAAQNIYWSNGTFGSTWKWGLGSGGGAVLNLSGPTSSPWTFNFINSNPATSGANNRSPIQSWQGAYWDGTVSQSYGAQFQVAFNAGAGGLATNAFKAVGTEPASGHLWSFDSGVRPPITVVGSLPSAGTFSGAFYDVTDSTAISAEGQTCVGGSTNKALAWSNGTVWKCF